MTKEWEILERLIDKYERSKIFNGTNLVKQEIRLPILKLYPKYGDDTRYEDYKAINESIAKIEEEGFVQVKRQKNGDVKSVALNIDKLAKAYARIGRTPKEQTNQELIEILTHHKGANKILDEYIEAQLERIAENRIVEHFDGEVEAFAMLLKALAPILSQNEEIYIRDYSVRTLGDSKAFEKLRSKAESILFNYGDFAQKETILEELNIVKNPGHVYIKGAGIITIGNQQIDLSKLDGDIAVSTKLLRQIDGIELTGKGLITIENLTSFNDYNEADMLSLYLGGYHNSIRREFLAKVHSQNPDKEYLHFGDIDAGGIYILEHLRRKTKIYFKPYRMDIATLEANADKAKPLTDNDRKRLSPLAEKEEWNDLVSYMLAHNCKLEQEAALV